MEFLDIGILIGMCLVFLKGIDLILRKHHKEQIQSFFDTLTLESEYYNPQETLKKLGTPGTQAFIVSLSYFVFIVIVIIVCLVTGPFWSEKGWLTENIGKGGSSLQLTRAIVSFFTLAIAWWWPIPRLLRLLVPDSTNLRRVLIRLLLFYFGVQLFLLFYLSSLHYFLTGNWNVIQIKTQGWSIYTFGELLVAWPIYTIFFITSFSVCIGVLAKVKPKSLSAILFLFRGFLWRIIEFEKGATAAIVLIITVIFSLIRILWA